jgi:hypothetical protein
VCAVPLVVAEAGIVPARVRMYVPAAASQSVIQLKLRLSPVTGLAPQQADVVATSTLLM